MKIIITLPLIITLVFAYNGKVIFNDGTRIVGQVSSVDNNSVTITPEGLTFPEQIMISNIDTLILDNGELLISTNKVQLHLKNGEILDPPDNSNSNAQIKKEAFEIEYVIVPNWSLNFYNGYPIPGLRGESFSYYDKIFPTFGLSVGSPYGIYIGDFFMNVIAELAYYKFSKSSFEGIAPVDRKDPFEGFAFQIGLSPGLFIGDLSISATAATGVYHAGPGFITGLSVDLPIGSYVMEKYRDSNFITEYEELLESLEVRVTSRLNLVKKNDGLYTFWLGGGISFGYEF